MRRMAGLIGLIAPLALAGTAGAASPASQTPRKTMVIVVKSITTASIPHDKAPKGASKGDSIVLRDRLVNVHKQFGKPAGATVGRDAGVLSLTSASSGTFEGVAQLPGGTVRLHGVAEDGRQTFTVTGGTGTYAHARGTVIVGSGTSPLNTGSASPATPSSSSRAQDSSSSMRWLPSVLGLTRSRSRNSATPSSNELRSSA